MSTYIYIHTSYTLLPLSAERKLFVNCYDLCRKSLLILSVAIGKKQPTLKRVFALDDNKLYNILCI